MTYNVKFLDCRVDVVKSIMNEMLFWYEFLSIYVVSQLFSLMVTAWTLWVLINLSTIGQGTGWLEILQTWFLYKY